VVVAIEWVASALENTRNGGLSGGYGGVLGSQPETSGVIRGRPIVERLYCGVGVRHECRGGIFCFSGWGPRGRRW